MLVPKITYSLPIRFKAMYKSILKAAQNKFQAEVQPEEVEKSLLEDQHFSC